MFKNLFKFMFQLPKTKFLRVKFVYLPTGKVIYSPKEVFSSTLFSQYKTMTNSIHINAAKGTLDTFWIDSENGWMSIGRDVALNSIIEVEVFEE